MIKEYVVKYKVFTIPFWYEFKCYAGSTDEAVSAFIREEPIGIEKYYISAVYDIK